MSDADATGGLTTRLGANWRIRWWHRWGRADFAAVIGAAFGFVNAGMAVAHGDYAGLGWLSLVAVGVVLFSASGLERTESSGGRPTPFDRLAGFGKRLDDSLDKPDAHND